MCCVSLDFNSFEHIFARWMTVKHDYEKNCFSCAPWKYVLFMFSFILTGLIFRHQIFCDHCFSYEYIFCLLPAFHESSLKSSQRNAFDGKKEGEIAALLSNHLLSCLVYGNKYLISNTYQKQPSLCPCLNPIQCMEHIPYGETGLGELSL